MTHQLVRWQVLRAASLALVFGALVVPAAAEALNPDADEILRSMSKFLAGAKAFSVSVDASVEVVTKDGQKLQMVNSASVLVERPSRFYLTRQGKFADTEAFFDGKKLTFYGKNANAYIQKGRCGAHRRGTHRARKGHRHRHAGGDLLLANPMPC